ncbi:MAG: hypothetical protein PHS41_07470 [Victivallaceae bacterium]|nr:hypothetical protein [Victivallaceae bacterium]
MSAKLLALADVPTAQWRFVLLSSSITGSELMARYLRQEFDGLLLAGHAVPNASFQKALDRIAHVWMNSHVNAEGENVIMYGNELAGRMAARYLLDHACPLLSCMRVESMNPGILSRLDGFRFECFFRRLRWQELPINGDLPFEKRSDADLEERMSRLPLEKVAGIFIPEERLTALFYRTLAKRAPGIAVPLVISCNSTPEYLAGIYPRPATIDLGAGEVAKIALRELARKLSEKKEQVMAHVDVMISPSLIEGETK